uniref:Transcription factor IIIC subunit 5 HTH domain-containing protein n=1 Tax=Rhodosorus marinus TaxID=101924 RepID=A0A7S3A4R0_9RHOD|mmetsp:Transcript_44777/g.173781  ORF Transcript_44777/g.173781 Transcript_44777/m.173781 type:complete len:462 (+) Transcript_44777:275-1660(+)
MDERITTEEEAAPERSLEKLPDLFCVEFPGELKDGAVDGAVKALGGWNALSNIMSERSGTLKLRLRDGHSGEIISNHVQIVSNLLSDDKGEVIATVNQSLKFSNLSDFTYVDRGARNEIDLSNRILDPVEEDLVAVRPAKLSRYEKPRMETALRGISKPPQDDPVRKGFAFARYDEDHVPITGFHRDGVPESSITRLKELFEQRPMWTRSRLTHELGTIENKDLIPALRTVAYRFAGSGPFRYVWIRLRDDPRESPETRTYQSIELRFHPLSEVAASWAEKFLEPHRLVAVGEEAVARRGRISFQICDVDIPSVKKAVAEANVRPRLSSDRWGFFERESFEKVYGSIKQELYKAVGYEEAPKMRRRRPMMDKMRLRARLEEELAGRTEDPMVKFSAEDPGDPGRQDSSEPEKESVSKQDETPEEPSRTIPAAASSSLDKHLAADVEDYEAYDIYDDDDSDE